VPAQAEPEAEPVAHEWDHEGWDEPVREPAQSESAWYDEPVEVPEPAASYDVPEPVDPEPVAPEPVVEEPVAEEPPADRPWAQRPWAAQPVAEATPVEEPVEEPVEQTVVEPVVEAPLEEAGSFRLQIRRPLSAAPAAAALEGDFVATDHHDDAPIFGQLRSNWLGGDADSTWSDDEVDRAWDAAERVESDDTETDADGTTRTGLPVRRPGGRLVPGGVSQEPAKVVRDPEAIRNRLAAHAAGVSRGRAAATGQPRNDDYAHEETGPA
jgi:hypothetical protein